MTSHTASVIIKSTKTRMLLLQAGTVFQALAVEGCMTSKVGPALQLSASKSGAALKASLFDVPSSSPNDKTHDTCLSVLRNSLTKRDDVTLMTSPATRRSGDVTTAERRHSWCLPKVSKEDLKKRGNLASNTVTGIPSPVPAKSAPVPFFPPPFSLAATLSLAAQGMTGNSDQNAFFRPNVFPALGAAAYTPPAHALASLMQQPSSVMTSRPHLGK